MDLTPVRPELAWQGAEAKVSVIRLYSTDIEKNDGNGHESKLYIAKERLSKNYRHPELDARLLKSRMLQEVRCMRKLAPYSYNQNEKGVLRVPAVMGVVGKNTLLMEYIEKGQTIRDLLLNADCQEKMVTNLGILMGRAIGEMHSAHVIHGDLTTANMLISINKDETDKENEQSVCLIDFGLAQVSVMAEDRAVDLIVLERAIVALHPQHSTTLVYT